MVCEAHVDIRCGACREVVVSAEPHVELVVKVNFEWIEASDDNKLADVELVRRGLLFCHR